MNGIPAQAIWVRFPRFIGDGIMIHRALEPLRAMGLPMIAWGPAPVVALFQDTACFAATVADPSPKPSAWAMARILRKHAPRAVINLTRSQRANVAALLARVPLRLGWREGLGSLLCNRTLTFKTLSGHQQDRYAQLLRTSFPDLPSTGFVPFVPGASAQAEADALIRGIGTPFLAFSLGAMSWSKTLAASVWIELCQQAQERGWSIVLLGAAGGDQACAKAIVEKAGPLVDLTGKTPLAVAAGVLRRSLGLVGNDSALSHLAAACGVPTVVAFGPTDPGMTAPVGAWVRVVRKEGLPCLGCLKGACPIPGHPCMKDIRAIEILQAMEEARLSAL